MQCLIQLGDNTITRAAHVEKNGRRNLIVLECHFLYFTNLLACNSLRRKNDRVQTALLIFDFRSLECLQSGNPILLFDVCGSMSTYDDRENVKHAFTLFMMTRILDFIRRQRQITD